MNKHDKFDLPPLPKGMILEGMWVVFKDELVAYRDACVKAAIEADRKRRGFSSECEPSKNGPRKGEQRFIDGAVWTCTDPEIDRWVAAGSQPAEPESKTDWNAELASWSDEDFIRIFHERPDLANRLRKILAEPVKRKRLYAPGSALGEFGVIPMCDQYLEEMIGPELMDQLAKREL